MLLKRFAVPCCKRVGQRGAERLGCEGAWHSSDLSRLGQGRQTGSSAIWIQGGVLCSRIGKRARKFCLEMDDAVAKQRSFPRQDLAASRDYVNYPTRASRHPTQVPLWYALLFRHTPSLTTVKCQQRQHKVRLKTVDQTILLLPGNHWQ